MKNMMVVAAVLLANVTTGAWAAAMQPVGGGITDGGLVGEYFANPDFQGEPAFSRRDVRVRFDWGQKLPILGVGAESLRNFPRDNFSIRWIGKLVVRFDEPYTFIVKSDGEAKLWVAGQPVGNQPVALKANTPVEVKLEYRDDRRPARVELWWASPSTPVEVIDPLSAGSISGNTYPPRLWAGIHGGIWRLEKDQLDANGWPNCDVKGWPMEGGWKSPNGRYSVEFTGKAELEIKDAEFIVGGKKMGSKLPVGTGYGATQNRTKAEFTFFKENEGGIFISFTKTQRTPSSPVGSGFTNLEIMKPLYSGADQPHESGEISIRGARTAFAPYASFRWQGLWNGGTWSQRALPGNGGRAQDDRNDPARGVPCFENLVLLANETGRDILMGFGASMDYDALKKMAQLFRYGSDGVNPYDHEVDNPVYPPLNPNLYVYLEHGNEMGWSAIQPRKWFADLEEHMKNNSPEWQIVNFDGTMHKYGDATYRYHAYRTVKCSQLWREVWGDAAMNDRIRPCLFGQGFQQYEPQMLQFVDAYFNNGDGKQHVKDPHPVSYHLFGSGVAIYYGSANVYGQLSPDWFADGSFEETKAPEGGAVLRPTGAWKFTGKAGVCNVKTARGPAVTGAPADKPVTVAKDGWYGLKFTVGPKDIYVYQLGRYVAEGTRSDHNVAIFTPVEFKRWNNDTPQYQVRRTTAAFKGVKAGQYAYGPVESAGWPLNWESFRQGPVRVVAGKSYYLLSEESAQGDRLASGGGQAAPGITIDGGAYSADGEKFVDSPVLGGVNMVFTDKLIETAEGVVGLPPDPNLPPLGKHQQEKMGVQSAFLCGAGAMSQEVEFREDGDYAVLFRAANGQHKANRFSVFIDEKCVWDNKSAGASRKPGEVLYAYSTKVLPLKAGRHLVRFAGTGATGNETVFIDGVQVSSISEIMRTIPSKGQETSGKASDRWAQTCQKMSDFARLWGLVPCTYEGGWSLGGDWDSGGMNHWLFAKFESPQTVEAGFRSVSLYSKAGGWMFAYGTYDQFPMYGMDQAAKYPLWQAMSNLSRAWVFNPDNGVPLPATLTTEQGHYWNSPDDLKRIDGPLCYGYDKVKRDGKLVATSWKSWLVIAPKSGHYRVSAQTSAGGQARLSADDATEIATGPSGAPLTGRVFLTAGQHTIKIKCLTGAFDVQEIKLATAKP